MAGKLGTALSSDLIVPRVTALPGSPSDGDLVRFVADATNKIDWMLEYYASDSKWQFIGGPPLLVVVDTSETRNNAAYGALTTAGPSITVPLAGDYLVQVGSTQSSIAPAGPNGFHSYDVGGVGASDNDAAQFAIGAAAAASVAGPAHLKTGLAALTALVSKYRSTQNTAFLARWMRVTPVRVS